MRFPLPFKVEVLKPPHPGSFGAVRKFDIHTGIDLYCPEGTEVYAIEPGEVISVEDFTGPKAGYPWWFDTQAVLVRGAHGVLLYGEVTAKVEAGAQVQEGQLLGTVKRVLRNDKGKPLSMLHFELYSPETVKSGLWHLNTPQPKNLRDPTSLLESCD